MKQHNKVTFATCYWKGKFRGRENVYTPDWVFRMERMVKRNFSFAKSTRFVCLTNVDLEPSRPTDTQCETIPLKYSNILKGWWSKMELFRSDLFTPGERVIYLDLDLVILNDLSPFVSFDADFGIVKSFGNPNKEKGTVHKYNSSVMVFNAHSEVVRHLWEHFIVTENVQNDYRGDQDFIGDVVTAKTFPENWITKLRYLDDPNKKPKEPKIVLCMPKKNNIAAGRYDWVREIWK